MQLLVEYFLSCLSLNTFYGAHSQLDRTCTTVLTILQVLGEKRREEIEENEVENNF